jgi:hypothetical protein
VVGTARSHLQEGAGVRGGDARNRIKIGGCGLLLRFSSEELITFRGEGVAPRASRARIKISGSCGEDTGGPSVQRGGELIADRSGRWAVGGGPDRLSASGRDDAGHHAAAVAGTAAAGGSGGGPRGGGDGRRVFASLSSENVLRDAELSP